MKILITAGGTNEPIDSVRTITNSSTGRLGARIAERFLAEPQTEQIYYLHGQTAIAPQNERVKPICIGSVADLEENIRSVFRTTSVDIVIHCMAVSDYRVKSMLDVDSLANKIADVVLQNREKSTEGLKKTIMDAILQDSGVQRKEKVSSDLENPMILLEKTKKIISIYRGFTPKPIIFGFKLLSGVPKEELIETAYRLLKRNDCDFVLANDMREVTQEHHIGYLISAQKQVVQMDGKEQIANAIVEAAVEKMQSREEGG